MRVLLVLMVVLVAGLAGCAGTTPKPASTSSSATTTAAPATVSVDTGGLEGTVTDDESSPVPGVEIAVLKTNLTTKTDNGGRFSFSQMTPGSFDVVFQKLGYDSGAKRVTVEAGKVTTLKLVLVPLPSHPGTMRPRSSTGTSSSVRRKSTS